MSELGDEKGMEPERSEDTTLRNSISEDLSGLTLSDTSSSSQHSDVGESSHSGAANPSAPGGERSHLALPSSPTSPAFQFCRPSSPASELKRCFSQSTVSPDVPSPKVVETAHDALIRNEKKLQEYDEAILLSPEDVNLRILRAEILVVLGRLRDAFDEFLKAQTIEPENFELHFRICLLYIRAGNVVLAEQHMNQSYPEYKESLSAKIEEVKGHLLRTERARQEGDWTLVLKEAEATISAGADFSPLIIILRAEMDLRMDRLDQAEKTMFKAVQMWQELPFRFKFNGMELEAYFYAVLAQIEMALGNFKSAVAEADKAYEKDRSNAEISSIRKNVRMASAAWDKGYENYNKRAYLEAYDKFKEGLRYAKANVNLLKGRSACNLKLQKWEECIEDCSEVLRFRPDHKKSLERRAYSYAKLKKWFESVKNYNAARKIDPEDNKVHKAQIIAQIKLADSMADNVSCMEDHTPVIILISTEEEFKEAISVPETSIAFFHENTDPRCIGLVPCVDKLCFCCHPWLNFLLVDITECPSIANSENIRGVPSLVIYKEGKKMREIFNPAGKELLRWVRDHVISSLAGKKED